MKRYSTRHPGIYYRLDSRNRRRYIVWHSDAAGNPHTKTLPLGATEKDALVEQGRLRQAKPTLVYSRMKFGEWSQIWLGMQEDRQTPEESMAIYRSSFARAGLLNELRLDSLNRRIFVRLIAMLREADYSASTIKMTLSTISVCLEDAIVEGHLSSNPVRQLTKRDRPRDDSRTMRVLTPEEIDKLLVAVAPGWQFLMRFLVFTGLRISEALALHWEDIDIQGKVVRVNASKTQAGVREVILPDFLVSEARRRCLGARWSQGADWVFAALSGRPVTRENALRALRTKKVTDAIGRVTLHELRHTYASILIGQGMDVTFVADQMGHSSPAVTLTTYAKLFDPQTRREEARQKLQEAFG